MLQLSLCLGRRCGGTLPHTADCTVHAHTHACTPCTLNERHYILHTLEDAHVSVPAKAQSQSLQYTHVRCLTILVTSMYTACTPLHAHLAPCNWALYECNTRTCTTKLTCTCLIKYTAKRSRTKLHQFNSQSHTSMYTSCSPQHTPPAEIKVKTPDLKIS